MDKMNLFVRALPFIGALSIIMWVAFIIRDVFSAGWAYLSVVVMIVIAVKMYDRIKGQGAQAPSSATKGKSMRIEERNDNGQIEGGKR